MLERLKRLAAAATLLAALAACGATPSGDAVARRIAALAGGLGDAGVRRLESRMDPPTLALARRFEPAPHVDLWDRPPGWTPLDLAKAPDLNLGVLSPADAVRLNALMPVADDLLTPAQPFYLRATGPERERATLCMTQAIYYEAALEPLEGQQAVAQIILNRLRHPDFPKSVCGVVYQGAEQITGCQFSFTCDGSRDRPPVEPYWSQAQAVAAAALDGFVQKDVASATHYHADYVFPRWGPEMVKIGQIGAHIFYRFPGPLGAAETLSGHYSGGELQVSMDGPSPEALLAAKTAADASEVPVEAVVAAATPSPTDLTTPRVPGQIVYGRRIPTREEIARMNALLEKIRPDAAAPGSPPVISPPPAPGAPSTAG